MVVDHFMRMLLNNCSKRILTMVSHHNSIFELMRIFGRTEKVAKKPAYCWTAAVDLKISKKVLAEFMEARKRTLNDLELKNRFFKQIEVVNFSIIHE